MKRKITSILILVLLALGFYLMGFYRARGHYRDATKMVADTLVVRDTHIIEKPVLVEKYTQDSLFVAVHDTTIINDTIFVALPMEKKIYKGEDYLAEISGYKPNLDRIVVYPKTTTIKETITQSVTNRNALSLGLEANYINSPFIPIYLEYERMLHRNASFYARVLYDIPSRSYGFGLGAKVSVGW